MFVASNPPPLSGSWPTVIRWVSPVPRIAEVSAWIHDWTMLSLLRPFVLSVIGCV